VSEMPSPLFLLPLTSFLRRHESNIALSGLQVVLVWNPWYFVLFCQRRNRGGFIYRFQISTEFSKLFCI